MAVQVLIRRKVIENKAKELSPLIVKLRSLATIQPGYISGETLNCIDPPDRNEYLVISRWHSVEDWAQQRKGRPNRSDRSIIPGKSRIRDL
jgi:heme-degrading monooxygenase HmoA